jgi:coproporphyrinogen III oxidase/oxygen-independent coproporphyrinogen-3 oxidase
MSLVSKYDVPAPRYTSYPTVPYWDTNPTTADWISHINNSIAKEDAAIALYLHIPFCETLCTFCGCNTSITKNHSVEDPYVEAILKEFTMYLDMVPNLSKRHLLELHLGGGSPTYLSEKNLEAMLSPLLSKLSVKEPSHFSIEVDPRRTRKEQLEVLYKMGFRRVSLGVQDFNPEVQRLINRDQPFDKTKHITDVAREIGFTSVNFDLIYGLPKQSLESIEYTIQKTLELKPDRIAFYSYAHVPWIKASQRLFTEDDLPKGAEKRNLYEVSRKLFEDFGYKEIGMDHFALETDSLWKSYQSKTLHRNFMGYTDRRTDLLLGLGVSSISDSWTCFHQNEKILKKYNKRIDSNEIPTLRGHILSETDLRQRKYILDLTTTWKVDLESSIADDLKKYLRTLEEDNLIQWNGNELFIPIHGRPFLRNICMGLDLRLREKTPEARVFSQAI